MAKVHEHYDTSEAYGACQTDDDHEDGDVLVIEREQVIGIAGTWPCHVTAKRGDLDGAKKGRQTDDVLIDIINEYGRDPLKAAARIQNIREGYRMAKQIARERGWPLRAEDDF